MPEQFTPGTILADMRKSPPLVQCITNYVAMDIAANVLLAAGASPAMVHAEEEAGEFAALAGALTINIGTISPAWLRGMMAAAEAISNLGRPWVLDPVAHSATALRRRAVGDLMALRPTIIRGNASEIMALGGEHSAGRGVDSGDLVMHAEDGACRLAIEHEVIVAVTGAVDFVTDGHRAVRISGGSPLMPKVTALGCSLTALVGAFAAVTPEHPFDATVAALASFAVAGETAGRRAYGPGSFAMHFLDSLNTLDSAALDAESKIEQV